MVQLQSISSVYLTMAEVLITRSWLRPRMGIDHFLRYAKRKSRAVFIFLVSIFLIMLFAYQIQGQNESMMKYYKEQLRIATYPRRFNFTQQLLITVVEEEADSSVCSNETQLESTTDFNTFDIYKYEIALNKADTSKATLLMRKKDKLQVFILPFTHVDPGWLKTFEAYTTDTNKILNNLHTFMTSNPQMTFMWAEFIFFERWWRTQNQTVKDDIKKLVKDGRLELASGSWVMTDEANAYYPISVDNIVEGHQFLMKELGVKPSVVWSNDPFGYSNSVSYLFNQAGLKRAVINRIHYDIKKILQERRAVPFKWRQYFDPSGTSDMLTQVLPYSHYDILNSCGPNPAYCCEFDFKRITHWSCPGQKPQPITPENVKAKSNTLLSELEAMSEMYESNVLLMMHGDDFRFDMIEEWHQHHDNFLPIFEEINKGDRAEIRFGTFTDYFNALEEWYERNNKQPPTLSGDFFPYKCAAGDLWVGYYSTRPFFKRQGRFTHYLIRAADLLSAQVQRTVKNSKSVNMSTKLEAARRSLSLFQHHDAITGTSKRHVMDNYSQLLHNATLLSKEVIEDSMTSLVEEKVHLIEYPQIYTETSTKIPLSVKDGRTVSIQVYNSLPYNINDVIALRVDTVDITVFENGKEIEAQIEPYIHLGDIAQKTFLITFRSSLSPLSTSIFRLKSINKSGHTQIAEIRAPISAIKEMKKALPAFFAVTEIMEDDFRINTYNIKTKHDSSTGLLTHMDMIHSGSHEMNVSFSAYLKASGAAYVMRVPGQTKTYITGSVPRILVRGPIQQSIYLFMDKLYQKFTAKNIDGILGQVLHFLVRIDVSKEKNTEVALRIHTDLNLTQFYSDSVGMQLLRRERHSSLPIPGNFYPMPTAAVIENTQTRLTVVSNVEHGVSPIDGGMEIIIERMLNQDDGKGLGSDPDSLPTDMRPVEMEFALLLEPIKSKQRASHFTSHTPAAHLLVQNILYPPVITAGVGSDLQKPLPTVTTHLPCFFQLLTVRPLSSGKRLLILYRNGVVCYSKSPVSCSGDVKTSLLKYLKTLGTRKVQESNLGVNLLGNEVPINKFNITIEPYKFLTLILTI